MQDREQRGYLVFGALLCAMHLQSGSWKGIEERILKSILLFLIECTPYLPQITVQFKFLQDVEKKNVVPLSPLCQTLHNVSQPFFHLKPLTGLASNQCGLSRGNGGFAHCTFFYFCIFRVYQLRASIAPSPFVQCLNQIKHL